MTYNLNVKTFIDSISDRDLLQLSSDNPSSLSGADTLPGLTVHLTEIF